MIFSILQVSRDRQRLLTAAVRHFTLCGILHVRKVIVQLHVWETSVEPGLPDENFNKKPNNAKKGLEKGQTDCLKARKNACLRYCHSLVTKKHLNYKNIIRNFLRNWKWVCTGAHYRYFSDFSWFVRFHTSGTMMPKFAYWSNGSFLHTCESHLPFTPVHTTRIITALPLFDVNVAFLSRRRRPVCKRWAWLVLYNTIHTTQCSECTHFQWLCKILLISERGPWPNIAFITKILQTCCQKNGIVIFSFMGTYFSEKRPKGRTNFLSPANLRWSQKDHKAN